MNGANQPPLFTAISAESEVHANHNEAHNSALCRRCGAYRRRQNHWVKIAKMYGQCVQIDPQVCRDASPQSPQLENGLSVKNTLAVVQRCLEELSAVGSPKGWSVSVACHRSAEPRRWQDSDLAYLDTQLAEDPRAFSRAGAGGESTAPVV